MATSLLLNMTSDQTSSHAHQTITKPPCGSKEAKTESSRSRGSRRANGKGPKKQPQRGLGVAQLERLRIQESWSKLNQTPPRPTTLPSHNLLQYRPSPILPFTIHDPFSSTSASTGCVPVRYGAAPNHVHGAFQCPPQGIHGNAISVPGQVPIGNNSSGLNVVGGGGGVGVGACGSGAGVWPVPNQVNRVDSYGIGAPVWSPSVGSPLETSKELSSMPNVHPQPESCDVCFKKKRFVEDNVETSNARRDRTSETWHINRLDHGFLGFIPHQPPGPAPNLVGENRDFYNRLARHDVARNLDECAEVVAVHRKGNSVSGRVFMEYEFFPRKDGRGTTSKELEYPTIGSVAVVGEASSSIAATPYGDTASNSIDLSLKLSC